MDKQERIYSAAIFVSYIKSHKGKSSDHNARKDVIFPVLSFNNKTHIVDVDAMLSLSGDAESDRFEPFKYVEGFMTSTGRFVDAKEAWKVALKAKQIEDTASLIKAMQYRIKMAISNSEEYGFEEYVKALEHKIKSIDTTKSELKPEDLY